MERDKMRYKCGHIGDVPACAGRGKARQERLVAYFNRDCLPCAEAHVREAASRITDTNGLVRGLSAELLAIRLKRLAASY